MYTYVHVQYSDVVSVQCESERNKQCMRLVWVKVTYSISGKESGWSGGTKSLTVQ